MREARGREGARCRAYTTQMASITNVPKTIIASSFVNALVKGRFMGFSFSIKDAHSKSCDATTGTRFQCAGPTHRITSSTHSCAVCGLALWEARIKTAL